jgi:NDP-sugar pyrophosphorylase family protein
MNGDLLTDIDFKAMLHLHRQRQAAATVGLYSRDVTIELGVIELDDADHVVRYIEKPSYHYDVSMGIYVLEPTVLNYIPRDQPFDLPDLIQALIKGGERVVGYKHSGYWCDIGRPDDYRRAQEEFPKLCARVLGDGPVTSVRK